MTASMGSCQVMGMEALRQEHVRLHHVEKLKCLAGVRLQQARADDRMRLDADLLETRKDRTSESVVAKVMKVHGDAVA